ncbi:hypothetical protein BJX62DRAFT_218347 [Aspergillus germanicus]
MMIPTWLPGVIGAGPPEQVPLATPSEPEPSVTTPRDSDSLPSSSSPIPSPTSPDSITSSNSGGGSSLIQGSSTTGSPLEEQNGPSTSIQAGEPTSTGGEPVSPEEPSTTHTGGASNIPLGMTFNLAVGFTLSVGLGVILAFVQ